MGVGTVVGWFIMYSSADKRLGTEDLTKGKKKIVFGVTCKKIFLLER
jgi:hypothetical protein